jgi:hypothetical protein
MCLRVCQLTLLRRGLSLRWKRNPHPSLHMLALRFDGKGTASATSYVSESQGSGERMRASYLRDFRSRPNKSKSHLVSAYTGTAHAINQLILLLCKYMLRTKGKNQTATQKAHHSARIID